MTTELVPENLAEFRARFGSFHDAVIHDIYLHVLGRWPYMRITLETIDLNASFDNQWVNLTIEVREVTDLLVKKPWNYDIAVIFNLIVAIFDDQVHINFSPYWSDEDSKEGYQPSPHPESDFIVIGKQCFWEVAPYHRPERPAYDE